MEVTKHKLTLPAQSWCLEELREFCQRNLQPSLPDAQIYRQIVLAIDEVAANIVEHAYPDGMKKENIALDIDVLDDRVIIEFRDSGIPFDPVAKGKASVKDSFSSRRKRGYGLAIIYRVVDELRYRRSERGENVLTLTKLFPN